MSNATTNKLGPIKLAETEQALSHIGLPGTPGRPKNFYVQENIGKCRYVVNFDDGAKTHPDGSAFYDIRIFSNKRKLHQFTRSLESAGFAKS